MRTGTPDALKKECHEPTRPAPVGIKWRSSPWFITLVIGGCVGTDALVCTTIIPVLPFQLERLGYGGVAGLVGWLLFAFSAGLLISTLPVALLSQRYNLRTMPLIAGLVVLLGALVMFMEAPTYWVMCVARILQGISSTIVWVVGLALLCDNVPEENIGRQLGLVMTGSTIGTLLGPPVGGALFSRFGFRGPFIFAIIAASMDLIGRLLVIERKDVLRYGVDHSALALTDAEKADGEPSLEAVPKPSDGEASARKAFDEKRYSEATLTPSTPSTPRSASSDGSSSGSKTESPHGKRFSDTTLTAVEDETKHAPPEPVSLVTVMLHLVKSPRTVVAFLITISYGLINSAIETAIPLHLQDTWGLDSSKVGLVFIAAVVPTISSSAIAGWYTDRRGTHWVTSAFLVLALPWPTIMIIQGPVTLFIVAFAVNSFFISGVLAPILIELAVVSRGMEGVGYLHVYGIFNIAYGAGTTFGPILGGQMYNNLSHGWLAICLSATGLLGACALMAFCATGDDPLLRKALRRSRQSLSEPAEPQAG